MFRGREFNEPAEIAKHEAHDWNDDGAHAGHVPVEDHAAHAPGRVCELCHRVIEAGQDARLRVDGSWIHEACPIQ